VLCARLGISRKSHYKYRAQVHQRGVGGLGPRSRRPLRGPIETPPEQSCQWSCWTLLAATTVPILDGRGSAWPPSTWTERWDLRSSSAKSLAFRPAQRQATWTSHPAGNHGRLWPPQGTFDAFARLLGPPPSVGGQRPGECAQPPATHPRSGAVDADTAMGGFPVPCRGRPLRTPQGIAEASLVLRPCTSRESFSTCSGRCLATGGDACPRFAAGRAGLSLRHRDLPVH
jgi:hypothetical protein